MTGEPYSPPAFTMADYNLYRLDDRLLFALLIAGLTFCVVHAARRAFRQPFPAAGPLEAGNSTTVNEDTIQRHTLGQRIYHWSNAVAVLTLVFSGWMLHQSKGFPAFAGTPSDWFSWHSWGAALFLVGLAFHVIYESFIARSPNPMAVTRQEAQRIAAILKNFFGLSRFYPLASKYHAGQIFFHWTVAGNLLALTLTGAVIWNPFRRLLPLSFFGLGWDFIFYCRLLHGFFSATLMASLIGHLYFALFIKKNWTEAKSMFTGRIPLREYLSSHSRLD